MKKNDYYYGLTALILFIMVIYGLVNNRYKSPLYFYINVQRDLDNIETDNYVSRLKLNISNAEYNKLLTWMILQHCNTTTYSVAKNRIIKEQIHELDTLVRISDIFFNNLPEGFTWVLDFPLATNTEFSTRNLPNIKERISKE